MLKIIKLAALKLKGGELCLYKFLAFPFLLVIQDGCLYLFFRRRFAAFFMIIQFVVLVPLCGIVICNCAFFSKAQLTLHITLKTTAQFSRLHSKRLVHANWSRRIISWGNINFQMRVSPFEVVIRFCNGDKDNGNFAAAFKPCHCCVAVTRHIQEGDRWEKFSCKVAGE